MGLSALEIYKLLPRTNCKKCGFATCMLFAMKVAQKTVDISLCPDLSDEAKRKLAAAARPPIQLVTIGTDQHKVEIGNETVLFRHEKTFYHPTGLFLKISSSLTPEEISHQVKQINDYKVVRAGKELRVDGFAIEDSTGQPAEFACCVEQVMTESPLPFILLSFSSKSMEAALEKAHQRRPLIYGANKQNWQDMVGLALKYKCPLAVVERNGLGELATLTEQISQKGIEEIVLDPGGRDFASAINLLTQIRRLAIKKNFSPLGYPVIAFPGEGASGSDEEVLLGAQYIAKYASLIVLNHFPSEALYPLLTLRLNIYTDPQKPIQVQPGVYQINNPKDNSPVCVTTNFSLTYFAVAGELESSGFPSWLLICDTDGLSVLASWAAGKFDGLKIASTVKKHNVAELVSHRNLIIPGLVAILKGEIEEELPGWQVLVGPKEAINLGSFLKQHWKN